MELPTESQSEAVAVHIGESLKKYREEAGATQAQIGQAIGEHRAMIAAYETGKRMIPMARLYAYCEALHVDWNIDVSPFGFLPTLDVWNEGRNATAVR